MKTYITEGLDYHDLVGQVVPKITVDEYAAKMGDDKDVVTLTFIVKSKQAALDLVDWFEKGYDFILDASLSDGEIEVGKWLIFVEMDRRFKVPERIVEILDDLKTLTDIPLKDWEVEVDGESYDANEKVLRQVIIVNPNEYTIDKENEEDLNEMRLRAGLDTHQVYDDNEYTRYIKSLAGM
jgi:hypothetical protein